jgi:hypothetical protein
MIDDSPIVRFSLAGLLLAGWPFFGFVAPTNPRAAELYGLMAIISGPPSVIGGLCGRPFWGTAIGIGLFAALVALVVGMYGVPC